MYWKQRSRADWLSAGDRNSKFFHSRATARKKKNNISKLLDHNGIMQESEEGIVGIIKLFFSDLYRSSNPAAGDIGNAAAAIDSTLDDGMINDLSRAFTEDEVKRAIFEMNPSKAPGPDGFQAMFFQKYWKLVGADFSKVCLQVLNGRSSIADFNHTFVALIPKIKNPLSPNDFRPISLCSVTYKAITKVLANRLKGILQNIISPSQSAFVPGRQIFDNVITSFELLHSISRKKKGKTGWLALKLDMSKAYDRIEWDFLKAIMEKMGFPPHWINLIMDCLSTSRLTFLLNGTPTCSVVPSRGLRQGCPLSPYLFILCAEALSGLIRKEESAVRGLGIQCCRNSPLISHLFFADDSILFCKASPENGVRIRTCWVYMKKVLGRRLTFINQISPSVRMYLGNLGRTSNQNLG
ncbi:hypothetical protein LWI29_034075 [Acer saccharum]|uniref:Reverse transcriptase domain-containing protein n=1 Tax=Acer saccharum TaxID=4024 RepID=A0AA39SW03_ACESA|nr:hypothetical protein LWI29_034075 [Acer saccharum]